jgi:hypothetical protein
MRGSQQAVAATVTADAPRESVNGTRRALATCQLASGLIALALLVAPPSSQSALAADPYAGTGSDLLGPAAQAAAVVPSDTANLPTSSKRLWVGGSGNVKLTTVGGSTVTYLAVPAGTYLQVRAQQVFATGTTATNIIAEY